MPTLAQARDGHYFVRHRYRRHATWQITARGVQHLRRRGIEQDHRFSTDHFMSLWRNAWIYTGRGAKRRCWPAVVGDPGVPEALRDAIANFFTALKKRDWEAAEQFVVLTAIDGTGEAERRECFRRYVSAQPIYSWQFIDLRTLDTNQWASTVSVRIGQSREGAVMSERDQRWTHTESGYRLSDYAFRSHDCEIGRRRRIEAVKMATSSFDSI